MKLIDLIAVVSWYDCVITSPDSGRNVGGAYHYVRLQGLEGESQNTSMLMRNWRPTWVYKHCERFAQNLTYIIKISCKSCTSSRRITPFCAFSMLSGIFVFCLLSVQCGRLFWTLGIRHVPCECHPNSSGLEPVWIIWGDQSRRF